MLNKIGFVLFIFPTALFLLDVIFGHYQSIFLLASCGYISYWNFKRISNPPEAAKPKPKKHGYL